MLTFSINSNIDIVKDHLDFIKFKLEAKEEIKLEIVQEAIDYYTKLAKQINELIESIDKYEKAMQVIDDYVDLIHDEVADALY